MKTELKVCPFCDEEKETITILGRIICPDCKKRLEEDSTEPDIKLKEHFNFWSSKGTYVHGRDGTWIELGVACDEAWILQVLLHEYHHHAIRMTGGFLASHGWDNVSPSGRIEREILSYNS